MTTEPNPNIKLDNVRTSYFFGHSPFVGQDPTKPNFGTHLLMPPDHPAIAVIKAAQRAVAIAQWGKDAEAVMAQLAAKDRLALHDGTVSKPGQEAYKGMIYVSANSGKKRFTIVDADRTPLTEADGRPYSGCYVNAIIQIWPQDNKWGKGINAQICGVQFLRHGEAFGGGRVATPDEFQVVAASTDAPPPSGGSAAGLF